MKTNALYQQVRLLPLVIGLSCVMLVGKIVDISLGSGYFTQEFLVSELHAKPAEETTPTPSPSTNGAAENPEAQTTGTQVAPTRDVKPSQNLENTEVAVDTATSINAPLSKEMPQEQPALDVKLLQSLSNRHKQLDDREKSLLLKETLLVSTEERVDQRIKSLEQLKSQVDDLLRQYNEKEDAKIRSLVKIYENMKPKDAAKIFDQMDMPILLQVVDKMKEAKAAPILAKMSPQRAKDLTIDLALQKKLPETIQ